jgi:hypothetical protein
VECPWCAMELERGTKVCPYCKNPVTVGSKGRNKIFKLLAVLALVGFIVLMLGDALLSLLRSLLPR